MLGKKKKEEKEKTVEQAAEEPATASAPDQTVDEKAEEQPVKSEETPLHEDQTAKYAELNDKYLRLYSDFDNYRKRTLKERIELNKYAAEEVITRLLPILDDFDRAIKSFDTSAAADQAFKDGMTLIYNKLLSILNQQGLEPMRAMGESFDTDFHEAITNIATEDPEKKGKIVDVLEKGYMMHGKVIRYAKVVVGN
jgi:molecular chaperone GrpE